MTKEITVGGKTIGLAKPVFISAEVGTTCNGDFETAKKLIDAAKEADMDAVKFQILDPEDKFRDKKNLTFTYTRHNGETITENIYEMLKQYVMPEEKWRRLKDYADQRGIIMFATPDYMAAVDLMEKLEMPAYKIATWDVTYYPFVEKIAALNKPTVLDFGASDTEEVADVLKIFKKYNNDKLILLHCYHTKDYGQINLRTIEYYRETFGYLSGFSAPDENNDIDYLSLAYQPVYIEKRLTLDRKDPRHHHSQALEPEEMKNYVRRIRELSRARGDYKLAPSEGDLKLKGVHFRSIVAKRRIAAGEILNDINITCRRPYYGGIDARYYDLVLGRAPKAGLEENEPITWEKI